MSAALAAGAPDHPGLALVIGMGAIGTAVAKRLCDDPAFARVVSISRREHPALSASHRHWSCDHGDTAIDDCVARLNAEELPLKRVVITIGTLHGDAYGPEKSLRQLDRQAMTEVHRINCVLPLTWLAALQPLLRRAAACRVLVLSARVGSIADNRRGGWYSYRSAKAALNMSLRSAAIEFAGRGSKVKLIAYHPGTVDSPLSAPFQSRLPPEQLFTADHAAERLLEVMEAAPQDGTLSYLDWAGKPIPW